MDFNAEILCENILFKNIPKEKVLYLLNSTACCIKTFNPQTNIYEISEQTNSICIVLEGIIDIVQTSMSGSEIIVHRITQFNNFSTTFSSTPVTNNINYIRSATYSKVLFIDIHEMLQKYSTICDYRVCLFENIIDSLTKNNAILNTKIQIMSQKTLRDKLISYFEILSIQNGSNKITIPFNREELAWYLVSERSSISRELSKLKEDNIININGNNVELLY